MRISRSPVVVSTILIVMMAANMPAGSATIPEADLCGEDSPIGVEAVVTDIDAHHVDDPTFTYAIETIATVEVRSIFRGHLSHEVARIWIPGGVTRTHYLLSPHVDYLTENERALLCLRPASADTVGVPTSLPQGPPVYFLDSVERLSPIDEVNNVLDLVGETVEDLPGSNYSVLGFHFEYPGLPSNFRVNENTNDVSGEGSAVSAGASTWQTSSSWVSFNYAGSSNIARVDPTDANVVFWNPAPNGTSSCVAGDFIARYWAGGTGTNPSHGENNKYDIEFNDLCDFSGLNIQSVAAHEFGHVLGLGHSPSQGNIMWATYNGQTSLGSGDQAGVRYLYPHGNYRAVTDRNEREVTLAPVDISITCLPVVCSETQAEQTYYATEQFSFSNRGRTPWDPFNEVRLRKVGGSCSLFYDPGTWLNCGAPKATGYVERKGKGAVVLNVRFRATTTSPLPGIYEEVYRLNAVGRGEFGPRITVTFTKI